ncbi:MAG: helix-turn-helix transcriptional regulator [Clostridia bacterium]|nr:helix-turn-helix transcriptional regulator [Clostridia bacterium]
MIDLSYEHHIAIRKDRLCPFKLSHIENTYACVCNWHKNIEVILITEGEGTVTYGSQELSFSRGDIIVVNSGVLHRLYSESGIDYYYMIVDEVFCKENGIDIERRQFTPLFRSDRVSELLFDAVKTVGCYQEKGDDGFNMRASKARLSVLALLVELCESHSTGTASCQGIAKPSEDYVKRVISYMAEHYSESHSLESLAAICGVNKCHLAREFRRYTGQTVMTYLNTLRCKNAESLIAGGMSVTAAAYECGFGSLSYFSRTYKRLIGSLPSLTLRR